MSGPAALVGAIALVALGGLFSALDAAIGTVSIARVSEMVREERPGAVRLSAVIAERPRYVSLVVLLRIVCETTATVLLVAYLSAHMSLGWALVVAAAIMVVTSFVLIGVGPRTVGRQNAYSISLMSAAVLQAISVLLMPISRLLILIGNALTPGRGFRNGPFASEIELREVVELAGQRGVVADEERRMIQSVFELGDTVAREVMVPRTEMVWIEHDKHAGQATSLAVRSGHSRIPVIGDNVDDVLGVVYLKDLVRRTYTSTTGGRDTQVSQVMRPAVFVPETKPLDDLLAELQRQRSSIAIVVDEYGRTVGIATVEDILEEVVGEIEDETDPRGAEVRRLADGDWYVRGHVSLGDLEDADIELPVDTDAYNSIGGYVFSELGRLPERGDSIRAGGYTIRVESVRENRIVALRIHPEQAADLDAAGNDRD